MSRSFATFKTQEFIKESLVSNNRLIGSLRRRACEPKSLGFLITDSEAFQEGFLHLIPARPGAALKPQETARTLQLLEPILFLGVAAAVFLQQE